ncbi:SusC/RagA family TonB-linked outer membrane protein [Maribacter sp. 2210JD10-5]|uniref:SusC/RagA family TonB-linked outer membrane protein n=1 Tax=Maribacter sp. 2210JD10-5 TaxID=3386272 RepID=UPI0039BD64F6
MNIKFMKGIFFFILLLSSSLGIAQTITGTVTSEGSPLPGASVVEKGTNNGTTTDFDGNYTLNNVAQDATLIVSYLGFVTKEVAINGSNTVNITLDEDVAALDEVVVIGYGTRKRSDVSTSVASVDSEKITALPVATVNEALEGRATGVQVRSGGAPGEGSTVTIRGFNTFGNGNPLYVVDGVFINDVTAINPNDIEKVDILKDAAAAAIYGSRGTNGVVIITTKKGREGKPKFAYNTYSGFNFLPKGKLYDLITSEQLIDIAITEDVAAGDGINAPFGVNDTPGRLLEPGFVPANTNWQAQVFQSAPITNHDFSVSGATEYVNYRVGAGIFDQGGIQIDTEFKRYNFSVNTDYKLGKFLKVGQTLNLGYNRQVAPERRGNDFLFTWATKIPSYLPPRSPDGRFTGGSRERDNVLLDAINPLLIAETQDNERFRTNIVGSVYVELQLAPGLTNRAQWGVNLFDQNINSNVDTFGPELLDGDGQNIRKTLQKQSFRNLSTVFTNVLSYNKSFGDHRMDASFIFEQTQQKINSNSTRLTNTDPNAITEFNNVTGDPATGQEVVINSFFRPNKLLSLAGRVGYTYKDKYILSGSIRRDADGKFEPGFRDEIFPAASAAWVISNESFLQDSNTISNLKLRGSFGVTGNNSAQQFATVPTLDPSFGSVNGFPGVSVNQIGSPFLTWETSEKTNFGLELGLFNNKFTLEADYFTSNNEDLIVVPIVDTSEGLNPNFINAGAVESKGYELTLGYNDYEGDFKWSVLANVSHVDPLVTRIADEVESLPGQEVNFGAAGGNASFTIPGEAPFVFFGHETDGLFESVEAAVTGVSQAQSYQEVGTGIPVNRSVDENGNFVFTRGDTEIPVSSVTLNPEIGTTAGDIRFKDQNGDGVIDNNDRVVIGNPNPDFTYSLNLNGSYKGFDASMYFVGVQGVDAFNHAKYNTTNYSSVRNWGVNVLDRYTASNPDGRFERYSPSDPNQNQRISTKYIEDGSYLRLRNVTLGYSLPQKTLGNILKGSIKKLRLYLSAQNILTITNYSGYDPEIRPSFTQGVIDGINLDEGFTPAPTTVLTGLQIEF